MQTLSWSDLGRSWGGLGRCRGDLGWSWGGLWVVLGRSWGALGRSWATLGAPWGDSRRPKIDPKIDPKLDAKTGRIATEKNGPNTTPVDVSELETPQRELDAGTQKSYQNRFRYD